MSFFSGKNILVISDEGKSRESLSKAVGSVLRVSGEADVVLSGTYFSELNSDTQADAIVIRKDYAAIPGKGIESWGRAIIREIEEKTLKKIRTVILVASPDNVLDAGIWAIGLDVPAVLVGKNKQIHVALDAVLRTPLDGE